MDVEGLKMDAVITNEKKKVFLKWLTSNYQLQRRESLWILDHLYSHDNILGKSHFVEEVKHTPRGIYMSVKGTGKPSFRFYKNGQVFKDPMQAFHEVRLNWSSDLYIEINFDEAWQTPEYLEVLEDNPYARWNDQVSDELREEMDKALQYESLISIRQELYDKIDQLLIKGEESGFQSLSQELEEIEKQLEEFYEE